MDVILPIEMTDSILVDTNIAENDYAEWAPSVTYYRGDFVISTATHKIYRALTDHASTALNAPDKEIAAINDPLIEDPNPQNWQEFSATNRWKPFDTKPSIQTENPESIYFRIKPNSFIGGMGFFGLNGATISIHGFLEGTPDVTIYDATENLIDRDNITGWWEYFFTDFTIFPTKIFTGLHQAKGATWDITISNPGGVAKVGQIAFGPLFNIGDTLVPGTNFSGLDFSTVEEDDFGNVTRVSRAATRTMDFSVKINRSKISTVQRKMDSLRGGVPAVWIGDHRLELAATIYGFSTDYRISYTAADFANMELEIRGLI